MIFNKVAGSDARHSFLKEIIMQLFAQNTLKLMKQYGTSDLINEVCGIGLGKKNGEQWTCTEFFPVTNVVKDNKFRDLVQRYELNLSTDYIPHPEEFLSIIKRTTHFSDEADKDLTVIFHTHPICEPIPSITDLLGAEYEAIYVIYSPNLDKIRAYYSVGTGEFYEVEIIK